MSETEIQQRLASAWEAGFYAGDVYGSAVERHDPQWDMDPPPSRPENPYIIKNRSAISREYYD